MKKNSNGKPIVRVEQLINWYWGNFCVKHEDSTPEHYEELRDIGISFGIKEMTHADFVYLIRQRLRCDPKKIKFHECTTCKALGIRQRW